MDTVYQKKIEAAIADINTHYRRALIADCYEGYDLRKLRDALVFLLDETYKR